MGSMLGKLLGKRRIEEREEEGEAPERRRRRVEASDGEGNREENNGIDFVRLLPLEMSQEIFSYLDPTDLNNCAKVSRSWKRATNSQWLWQRVCGEKKKSPDVRDMIIHMPSGVSDEDEDEDESPDENQN